MLAGQIIQRLCSHWGEDEGGLRTGEVDLYNINIPMIDTLLTDGSMPVVWTRMYRNTYGQLFKQHEQKQGSRETTVKPGGPDANIDAEQGSEASAVRTETLEHADELIFSFSPTNMQSLINPPISSLPVGTDTWALAHGWASVTPLRASFAETPGPASSMGFSEDELVDEQAGRAHGVKKLKLKL